MSFTIFLKSYLFSIGVVVKCVGSAALRGVATLKARVLKEVWNIATVIPVERGIGIGGSVRNNNNNDFANFGGYGEGFVPEENFLGVCNQELLARGRELLKRTRQGNPSFSVVLNECSTSKDFK